MTMKVVQTIHWRTILRLTKTKNEIFYCLSNFSFVFTANKTHKCNKYNTSGRKGFVLFLYLKYCILPIAFSL